MALEILVSNTAVPLRRTMIAKPIGNLFALRIDAVIGDTIPRIIIVIIHQIYVFFFLLIMSITLVAITGIISKRNIHSLKER